MNEVKYLVSVAEAETIDETEPPPARNLSNQVSTCEHRYKQPDVTVALNQLARDQTTELDTMAAIVQVAVAPAASDEEEVGEQSTAEVESGSSRT